MPADPLLTLGPWQLAFLVVAGVGAGLTGSIAGLASLVSYPALLAVGVPPVSANVTNTVALMGNTVGAAAGSRPELRGQRNRLLRLCAITAVGGAAGSALLLLTPEGTFASIVPFLIAGASVLLLFSPRLAERAARGDGGVTAGTGVGAFLVAIYGGYFGAAAGVVMLALLSAAWAQPLARTNAAKNVVTGAANMVAALVFAFTGPVLWPAAAALCVGLVAGSFAGPAVVRRLPPAPLRIAIALAGLGLAGALGWQAWA
ncbi:sulfite exporter TauE/SafE family protein [Amycolatopsis thermophila]|uniref:Probable membrane transporter protein n=1 Tax=Amycolatopsis thermophila TaxID=206084 RepID=A0ABU0EZ88_9PSEU|nr:sulfite exporter TauE/SafE family protein [Amycolatopsis thermophila]MDQ0380627.1 putative membrane protein YfcA [Amycolatopsis thermophila]